MCNGYVDVLNLHYLKARMNMHPIAEGGLANDHPPTPPPQNGYGFTVDDAER